MKKLNIFGIFFLLLLPFLTGCSQEEIVFESELPRFELRPGYQLLEVIVPQGTMTTDKIYIIGEFNGGRDAVGDPRWELEKAPDTDVKWGVYLNPSDFINGKTLADGYTFYSEQQGVERSLENTAVIHTESPKVGERMNVIVYRWAEYFNKPANPDEIVHDGYVIYVVDNSGYNDLAMYAYGDAEAFGAWPGIKPTGKVEIDGVIYKYFDTGAENEGLNLNLIFNNNDGGQQLKDYNVTLNQDFYLELTPDGVVEFDPNNVVKHDGYTIFIANNSGWDEVYVYMWGTVNDLNGAWPGMAPTGTQVIKGVPYLYYDLGAANCNGSLEQHVIINNNNGKQFDDVVVFNLDRDVYIELTSKGATEFDPATYTPEITGPVAPEPQEYKIYVQDETGWDNLYVYAYGDNDFNPFGAWPGETTTETKVVGAHTYKVFTVTGEGEEVNLIFNNNKGSQTKELKVTLDQDYFIVLANAIQAEVTDPEEGEFSIYIEDKTGWDKFYVYAWGDKEIFGGWPGVAPDSTATVDGITYKVLTVKGLGETENLIFNNNGGDDNGIQYNAATITLDKNYFITAEPDTAIVK